jgi:hypothetical protein
MGHLLPFLELPVYIFGSDFIVASAVVKGRSKLKGRSMSRRTEWQRVLDAAARRWSEMSAERLIAELNKVRAYEIEVESKRYQVEVELLEIRMRTFM